MRAPLAALLASVSLACGAAPGEERLAPAADASLAPRIVNGKPSTAALDAVVFLNVGQGSCTGTLLAPNLILTARHCIAQVNEDSECGSFGANVSPSTVSVSVGQAANGSQTAARASRIFTEDDTSGCGFDIALLLLDRDVAGARIGGVRRSAARVGERAKAAGYGDDGTGKLTAGRFERSDVAIQSVGPASFTFKTKTGEPIPVTVPARELGTGESTCFGDSGGPLLDEAGLIIGVTSRGVADTCVDRPVIYSAVASHLALIDEAAKASGHPLEEGGAAGPEESTGEAPEARSTGDGDDGEAATTRRREAPGGDVASSGCTTSPPRAGGESLLVALLALIALLAARRRA